MNLDAIESWASEFIRGILKRESLSDTDRIILEARAETLEEREPTTAKSEFETQMVVEPDAEENK